ncbi:hypothetical protein GOD34_10070 [Sinorhizobium medicae]|nr:hypothetical protein [Sinorhizobium medicae]
MVVNQKSLPDRAGPIPGDAEPDEHVADAGDSGGVTRYLDQPEHPDPPQPKPRNFSAFSERPAPRPASEPAEEAVAANDATGGEYWNRVLGDNTNAGTLRFLAAVGLFVLIAAALFWLAG